MDIEGNQRWRIWRKMPRSPAQQVGYNGCTLGDLCATVVCLGLMGEGLTRAQCLTTKDFSVQSDIGLLPSHLTRPTLCGLTFLGRVRLPARGKRGLNGDISTWAVCL